MWAKIQTFDLSDTCTLVPHPLTHAKENKGTRRGSKPQRVENLGKVILKTRGDAGLFIFICLLKRYLMSIFETVLGSSSRQERPLLWALPFRGPHFGPPLAAPLVLGKEPVGPRGDAHLDMRTPSQSPPITTTPYLRYSESLALWPQVCFWGLCGPLRWSILGRVWYMYL